MGASAGYPGHNASEDDHCCIACESSRRDGKDCDDAGYPGHNASEDDHCRIACESSRHDGKDCDDAGKNGRDVCESTCYTCQACRRCEARAAHDKGFSGNCHGSTGNGQDTAGHYCETNA